MCPRPPTSASKSETCLPDRCFSIFQRQAPDGAWITMIEIPLVLDQAPNQLAPVVNTKYVSPSPAKNMQARISLVVAFSYVMQQSPEYPRVMAFTPSSNFCSTTTRTFVRGRRSRKIAASTGASVRALKAEMAIEKCNGQRKLAKQNAGRARKECNWRKHGATSTSEVIGDDGRCLQSSAVAAAAALLESCSPLGNVSAQCISITTIASSTTRPIVASVMPNKRQRVDGESPAISLKTNVPIECKLGSDGVESSSSSSHRGKIKITRMTSRITPNLP